jgi:hypothetical protein
MYAGGEHFFKLGLHLLEVEARAAVSGEVPEVLDTK